MQLKEELDGRVEQGMEKTDYRDVIDYMLEHNCKLEQEAVKAEVFS